MRLHRIKTIIRHTWYHMSHSVETWMDLLWMPLMHTIVFGFMVAFFIRSGSVVEAPLIMVGTILWYMIEVGSYSVAVGALWEIWSSSFSSLFVTPLTLGEFVAGQMLFSMVKQALMFVFLSVTALLVFNFSIFSLGPMIFVYLALLSGFAWTVGMFTLSLILRFGTKIQSLAWSFIYIIQPLVGVFYPIEILPSWLQYVSRLFPLTYVFSSARDQYIGKPVHTQELLFAAVLNVVYFAVSAFFLSRMWAWSKRTGALVRMET